MGRIEHFVQRNYSQSSFFSSDTLVEKEIMMSLYVEIRKHFNLELLVWKGEGEISWSGMREFRKNDEVILNVLVEKIVTGL